MDSLALAENEFPVQMLLSRSLCSDALNSDLSFEDNEYFCSGGGNLPNFEFIKDGIITGLS